MVKDENDKNLTVEAKLFFLISELPKEMRRAKLKEALELVEFSENVIEPAMKALWNSMSPEEKIKQIEDLSAAAKIGIPPQIMRGA